MANSLGEMEITMLNGKSMGMLNMKWEGSNSIAMERMTIWRLMQLRIYSLEESFYSCMVWNGVMNDWSISKRRRNEYFSGFWMSFQMPIQTQAAKVISAVWVVSFEMPIWIGNAKFECLFELRYRRCMHNLAFSAADFAALFEVEWQSSNAHCNQTKRSILWAAAVLVFTILREI